MDQPMMVTGYFFFSVIAIPPRTTVSKHGLVVIVLMNWNGMLGRQFNAFPTLILDPTIQWLIVPIAEFA